MTRTQEQNKRQVNFILQSKTPLSFIFEKWTWHTQRKLAFFFFSKIHWIYLLYPRSQIWNLSCHARFISYFCCQNKCVTVFALFISFERFLQTIMQLEQGARVQDCAWQSSVKQGKEKQKHGNPFAHMHAHPRMHANTHTHTQKAPLAFW